MLCYLVKRVTFNIEAMNQFFFSFFFSLSCCSMIFIFKRVVSRSSTVSISLSFVFSVSLLSFLFFFFSFFFLSCFFHRTHKSNRRTVVSCLKWMSIFLIIIFLSLSLALSLSLSLSHILLLSLYIFVNIFFFFTIFLSSNHTINRRVHEHTHAFVARVCTPVVRFSFYSLFYRFVFFLATFLDHFLQCGRRLVTSGRLRSISDYRSLY